MFSQFQMLLREKKEMEVWLNYFHLKKFSQLYISCSFIKHFHIFFFLHQNSSFSLKDTDRKLPSNVGMSLSAGLWSLTIKSGALEYGSSHVDVFPVTYVSLPSPFPQSGSVHQGCTGTT